MTANYIAGPVSTTYRGGDMVDGLAADDGAALHFLDRELLRVITSRPDARGYSVAKAGDTVEERELPVTYLG